MHDDYQAVLGSQADEAKTVEENTEVARVMLKAYFVS
jgi:hypothetical protein